LKALQVLADVGDSSAGEWFEDGDIATHLRRRLSTVEAATVNEVVDIRGTDDARRRYRAMERYFPNKDARLFAEDECRNVVEW
jgi:hypothetical protein